MTITQIEYHRNGVSGRGFYAVTFTCPDNGNMLAAIFPSGEDSEGLPTFDRENPEIAVFNRDALVTDGVTFGRNSWRGDRYSNKLIAAIRKDCQERWNLYDDNGNLKVGI